MNATNPEVDVINNRHLEDRMKPTWTLVADRSEARLFRGAPRHLRRIETFSHVAGRLKDSEIYSDRAGRSFDSMGKSGHANQPAHSPSENLAIEFARMLAGVLERGRTDHQYEALVVVADSKFLGRLRHELTKETAKLVVGSLARDLSGVFDADLPRYLAELDHASSSLAG